MLSDLQLEKNCKNTAALNLNNLIQLMQDNKDTAFGRMHHFSEIRDVAAFRRYVPISDYSDYRSSVSAMQDGKVNLLTAYPVAGYCRTSGSEGTVKYIPLTYEALERYSDQSERYKNQIFRETGGGKRLFINTFRTEPGNTEKQVMLFSEIYNRWMFENGYLHQEEYAGGIPLLFDKTSMDTLYAKVWISFLTRDLVLIEAAFLYDILNFFNYMERHWKEMLLHIRQGIIPDTIRLSAQMRQALLSCPVDLHRLEEVETECNKGFENIAKRLWRDLRLLCGISNRSFFLEDAALKCYVGDLPQHFLAYCASECYIGTPLYENDFGYVLLPQNAFYEFIPYQQENAEPLLPQELKPGGLYEILITNFSGLYRYRLGDVVRVIDFYYQSPVLEFAFRKYQAMNLAGEKISIMQLEQAVAQLKQQFPIESFCFGTSVRQMPGIYYVLAVMQEEYNSQSQTLAAVLDGILAELNSDYADLRSLGHLGMPESYCMSLPAFSKLVTQHISDHRHNKPIHILPPEISETVLKEMRTLYEKS